MRQTSALATTVSMAATTYGRDRAHLRLRLADGDRAGLARVMRRDKSGAGPKPRPAALTSPSQKRPWREPLKSRKLDGKIALISGGTSGIGAETAKLFQSEGATVVVIGSSERSVEAAKPALSGIDMLVSDAGDVAATKALVDQVKAKHGRIDVLFVNAGIAKLAPIAQVDEAFYDSQFNINVKGAFFLIKHAIPIIPDGGAS